MWPAVRTAVDGWGRGQRASPTGGWGADARRPAKTPWDERQTIAICPRFAVAFKQRHSEALGGATPGYRSCDAIGQSATWGRGGGLGHSVGLRVKASYSVTSSNEVYDSCGMCVGDPTLIT